MFLHQMIQSRVTQDMGKQAHIHQRIAQGRAPGRKQRRRAGAAGQSPQQRHDGTDQGKAQHQRGIIENDIIKFTLN